MPMPIGRMRTLVLTGQATRLFPADPVSPARYHGRWWIVPTGHHDYIPADAARAAALDHAADRLAAADIDTTRNGNGNSGPGRET